MVDWLEAAASERQVLYRACKRLKDEKGWDWNELRSAADMRCPPFSDSFENNFRAGRISRRHAFSLGRWLANEHPEVAQAVEREIEAIHEPFADDPWEAFLRTHGTFGQVEAHQQFQQEQHQTQVQQPGEHQFVSARFKLRQSFVFIIDSPIAGVALGLQWIRDRWMLLPLSWRGLGVYLKPGTTNVPAEIRDETGVADSGPTYAESSETGLHRYVVMIAPEAVCEWLVEQIALDRPIANATLAGLAQRLGETDQEQWRLLRVNLMFYSLL